MQVIFVQVRHQVACENIRFSTLFTAGDVSRGGTSPAAKSEEKRMFSQARHQVDLLDLGKRGRIKFRIKDCLSISFVRYECFQLGHLSLKWLK